MITPPERAPPRYRLLREVGSGGMSIVYAALDRETGREVALKVLRPDREDGPGGERKRARLVREARALELVSHPNVIRVFDAGALDERLYIAMELIEGGSLREWLRETPRSYAEIFDVFAAAGRGISAIHAAGLVHRDLKPGNILIGRDGRVVVTDLGLVRVDPAEVPATPPVGTALVSPLTRPGSVLGTPGYMAPEQIQGRPADARSDQFGFAVSLYESLYGERPFSDEAEGVPSWIAAALEVVEGRVRPPPPGSTVPEPIRSVLLRGLSVDPAARYASIASFVEHLARAAAASGVRPPELSRVLPGTDRQGRSSGLRSRGSLRASLASIISRAGSPRQRSEGTPGGRGRPGSTQGSGSAERRAWGVGPPSAAMAGVLVLVVGGAVFAAGRSAREDAHAREALRRTEEAAAREVLRADVVSGLALARAGELDAARAGLEPALERVEAARGVEHLDTAIAAANLAAVRSAKGEHTLALPLYQRALPILERNLGSGAAEVGTVLCGLAGTRWALGSKAEAIRDLERARAVLEVSGKGRTLVAARAALLHGERALAAGQVEVARAALGQAILLFEELGGAPEALVDALVTRGIAAAMARDPRAIADLERARDLARARALSPRHQEAIEDTLARVRAALAPG